MGDSKKKDSGVSRPVAGQVVRSSGLDERNNPRYVTRDVLGCGHELDARTEKGEAIASESRTCQVCDSDTDLPVSV